MNAQETHRSPAAETLSRPQAIARIRQVLAALQDEDRCACSVTSRYGIFCRGFDYLSDEELRRRFFWIARPRPGISREELEELISKYHLGREQVTGSAVCCDVETQDHCGCDGWNSFDNQKLADFCLKLTGRAVKIR